MVMAASYAKSESIVLAFLILGLSAHFAAVQFGALVLIGFFSAKLSFYRLTNRLFLKLGFGALAA